MPPCRFRSIISASCNLTRESYRTGILCLKYRILKKHKWGVFLGKFGNLRQIIFLKCQKKSAFNHGNVKYFLESLRIFDRELILLEHLQTK